MGKALTLYFPGTNGYFYDEFTPLAVKIEMEGPHDEGSVAPGLENSVGKLGGAGRPPGLRAEHRKQHRGRRGLRGLSASQSQQGLAWRAGHGHGTGALRAEGKVGAVV